MFTYIRPVEVTDENSGHVDFPSEWYDLLAFGTADMLIAEYSVPDNVTMKITTKYAELLDGALGYDNQGFVDIEIDYEVAKKIEDGAEKIRIVFASLLKIPDDAYDVKVEAKKVTLKVPEQVLALKDHIITLVKEHIKDLKDAEFVIEIFKKDKKGNTK